MKSIFTAFALSLSLMAPVSFATAGEGAKCACDSQCETKCAKGGHKDCKCKHCGCGKTGKCDHEKCNHPREKEEKKKEKHDE